MYTWEQFHYPPKQINTKQKIDKLSLNTESCE